MAEERIESAEGWFLVALVVALVGFCALAWGIYVAGTAICNVVAEYLRSLAYC